MATLRGRITMSTELSRLSELAKADKTTRFLSLAHLVTPAALMTAFEGLRKDASAGVDEVTYVEYEQNVWQNIPTLYHRLANRQYRARPLRRVYIPKEDGTERPISIPALEDKIFQKATATVLNAIDAIRRTICRGPIAYVLEADIQGDFEAIVRDQLMAFVERRIGDSSILRLIRNGFTSALSKTVGFWSQRLEPDKGRSSVRCWRIFTGTTCSMTGLSTR